MISDHPLPRFQEVGEIYRDDSALLYPPSEVIRTLNDWIQRVQRVIDALVARLG
jgi:hypothetical protein